MTWTLRPFVGVGPLSFGMQRKEVQDRMGSKPRRVAKEPGKPPVDQYGDEGVQAYFDDADRLEFVELTPKAAVDLSGVQLLGRDLQHILNDLEALGHVGHSDQEGDVWFPNQGFVLYVEGDQIAAVSLYSRSYADQNPPPPLGR
jgi:hypothetical protein